MSATPYNDVDKLLDVLLARIQSVLHNKFIGLYLYGSLASGDFDHDISDIDLLVATSKPVDETEFESLKKMHDDFAYEYKVWKDRIEVQYVSLSVLRTFKTQTSKIVNISPGKPIHFIEAGKDWLINWYIVQENGIALFGPNQSSIIPKITKDEYINTVKKDTLLWKERIKKYTTQSPRGPLAYVVFTLCRALYGYKHGKQVSKKQAASWAAKEFPEWASLIDETISWRNAQWDNEQKGVGSALSKVNEFVNFAINQL
jgi:predicted nucleotidyltransferase